MTTQTDPQTETYMLPCWRVANFLALAKDALAYAEANSIQHPYETMGRLKQNLKFAVELCEQAKPTKRESYYQEG